MGDYLKLVLFGQKSPLRPLPLSHLSCASKRTKLLFHMVRNFYSLLLKALSSSVHEKLTIYDNSLLTRWAVYVYKWTIGIILCVWIWTCIFSLPLIHPETEKRYKTLGDKRSSFPWKTLSHGFKHIYNFFLHNLLAFRVIFYVTAQVLAVQLILCNYRF